MCQSRLVTRIATHLIDANRRILLDLSKLLQNCELVAKLDFSIE